jgi:hypothetical protein
MPKNVLAKNNDAMTLLAKMAVGGSSVQQIQGALSEEFDHSWDLRTIRKVVKGLGLTKKPSSDDGEKFVMKKPPIGVEESEKADWYRHQVKQSYLFRILLTQFDVDEAEVYLIEWGNVCCQFEDIVHTEYLQIDDYLKHRIQINQCLSAIKSANTAMDAVNAWIAENQFSKNELSLCPEDREAINKARVEQHRRLDFLAGRIKNVQDRYDKLVAERQKLMAGLAATRKDRRDEIKTGRKTFFDLMVRLQESDNERRQQGKLAALTKLAGEHTKQDFRKPIEFPDGQKRPIIVDQETEFE